jgi:hypothetical protein
MLVYGRVVKPSKPSKATKGTKAASESKDHRIAVSGTSPESQFSLAPYTLCYGEFLPLMEGDYICMHVSRLGEGTLTPTRHPIVKMSNLKEDIIRYAYVATRRSEIKPTMMQLTRFYDELAKCYQPEAEEAGRRREREGQAPRGPAARAELRQRERDEAKRESDQGTDRVEYYRPEAAEDDQSQAAPASMEEAVVSRLDDLAECYDNLRSQTEAFGLPSATAIRILKWWHRNRVLRRFYLLGLRKTEIRGASESRVGGMKMGELYKQITKNPFRVLSIELQTCLNLLRILPIPITQDDVRAGTAIRLLHDNIVRRAWSMTPMPLVAEICPPYPRLKEILEKHYDTVEEYGGLYLHPQRSAECSVRNFLCDMAYRPPVRLKKIPYHPELTETQNIALKTALTNGVSLITGPAGTGKTRVIKALVHELEDRDVPYRVASFTGKAVARVMEVLGGGHAVAASSRIGADQQGTTGSNIATFHRLANSASRTPFSYLIVDETSMVTTGLFSFFINAVKTRCNVVFLGDPNQLPPISWGCLLDGLIASERFPHVRLTEIKRCDNEIAQASSMIAHGAFPGVSGDGFRIEEGEVSSVIQEVARLKESDVDVSRIKVISPYNKCLVTINEKLQRLFTGEAVTPLASSQGGASAIEGGASASSAPPGGGEADGELFRTTLGRISYIDNRSCWQEGDVVMMTTNNYSLNVMNGEEGFIEEVTLEHVKARFNSGVHAFLHNKPDQVAEGDRDDPEEDVIESHLTKNLILSYGITVHKAQGSEWDHVIFYCPQGSVTEEFLNRHLVYTAFTRARLSMTVIGDVNTFRRAIATSKAERHEAFSERFAGH